LLTFLFKTHQKVQKDDMMKLLPIYILIFTTVHLSAQSVDKTVMASAGNTMSGSEVTIGFTIGEPIVGMTVSKSGSIDQGFWAGSLQVEAITAEKNLDGIVVYPNPVENELTIFTDNNEIFGITLFGMNGQRVFKQNVENTQLEHTIDLSYLSKGVYVLRLFTQEDAEAKLFKIIKK